MKRSAWLTIAICLLVAASPLGAGSINVLNASFEDTPQWCCHGDWGLYAPSVPYWSGSGGVFQPTLGVKFNELLSPQTAANNGGDIYQSNVATLEAADGTYTLSVAVGRRLDGLDAGFNGAYIGLYVGADPATGLVKTASGPMPGAGRWTTWSLNFDPASGKYAGQSLGIVLHSGGVQINFDEVNLVDPPPAHAPEPGTLLLLGTGLIGIARLFRRRIAA